MEALHHAYVCTELERGLYTGFNKRSEADGSEDGCQETSKAFFFRLEYQDGKRKREAVACTATASTTSSTRRRWACRRRSVPLC